MKLWLSCFLIAVSSLFASAPARACDTQTTAKPDSDCIVMAVNSVRGVWFQLEKADELRKTSLELPQLKLQLAAFDKLSALRDSQIAELNGAIAAHKETIKTAMNMNELLIKDARLAREDADKTRAERDAWYRSPWLWAGVGAAGAVGAGVAFHYIFQR